MQESDRNLNTKFKMVWKEWGLKIVFNVQPATKSVDYKKADRLKIKNIF